VHEARQYCSPQRKRSAREVWRVFLPSGQTILWWRWACAHAAVADAAPDVCIRFAPKPEKTSRYLREGLVDLEIGVQSNMGPEIRLQRLFEDRFVGVVRKGHPLAKQAEIGVGDYVAWGHVVASPEGALHGSVDDALAELGTKRKIASVVPGFPTALSVALESDLIAMIPALYLLNQHGPGTRFRAAVQKPSYYGIADVATRMERDPGHRWLRKQILAICGGEVSHG
jgi:DNA-binding transcriptional LysR family regulator